MQTRNLSRGVDNGRLLFGLLAIGTGIATGMLVAASSSPLVLIAAAVGLVAVFATIKQIELGLLALVFMTWTRLSDIAIKYHSAPSLAQWFFVLLMALILIRWLLYGERPQGWVRVAALIGGYGMIGMASLFFAADFARGQAWLVDYAKDGAIAVIVALLITRAETLRRVIWALLIAGLFLGTITVFQYLTGTFTNNYGGFAQATIENIVGETNNYRIAGPVGDPNYYAQILLVLAPLALDRALGESSRWLRLLAIWALIVCALAVVFTFSRGGFLALAAVVAIRLAVRPPNLPTLLIIGMLGVALFSLLPANYTTRLEAVLDFLPGSTQDPRGPEVALRGRTSAFMVSIMMFADHPILGVGKMNYPVNYQRYSQVLGIDPRTREQEPHNLYLEVLSETGLVGLVVFSALLYLMFRGMFQARSMLIDAQLQSYADMLAALMLGITGYLIASLFLHAAYPRYFWLLVGIALAAPEFAKYELELYREKRERAARASRHLHSAHLTPVPESNSNHG